MRCYFCGKEMLHNEAVVMQQYGEIVNGEFMGTEEPSIHHDDCGEDED